MNGKSTGPKPAQPPKRNEALNILGKLIQSSSEALGGTGASIGEAAVILGAININLAADTLDHNDIVTPQKIQLDTSRGGNWLMIRLDKLPPIDESLGGINMIAHKK